MVVRSAGTACAATNAGAASAVAAASAASVEMMGARRRCLMARAPLNAAILLDWPPIAERRPATPASIRRIMSSGGLCAARVASPPAMADSLILELADFEHLVHTGIYSEETGQPQPLRFTVQVRMRPIAHY